MLVTILAIIIIFFAEGLPMLRNKRYREVTVALLLMGLALLLAIGKQLGIQSPVALLDGWLSNFGKSIF